MLSYVIPEKKDRRDVNCCEFQQIENKSSVETTDGYGNVVSFRKSDKISERLSSPIKVSSRNSTFFSTSVFSLKFIVSKC